MSFVTVPPYFRTQPPSNASSAVAIQTTGTGADLNGVGHYVAWVDYMPRTATIDRVFFRITSATTGCTALVRIETVDTATGLPTGTLVHANASQSVVITTGAANYEVTFGAGSFSIADNTLIAIVVAQSSGTPVAVQFTQFSRDNIASGVPYLIDYDSSAVMRPSFALCMGLGEAGGGAVSMRHLWPVDAASTITFNSTNTPDTVGNKIVLAAPVRARGAWVWVDADAEGTVKLYGTDGATVIASAPIFTSIPPTTAPYIAYYDFSAPVELPAGTYYLAVEATTGSDLRVFSCTFLDSGWRLGSPLDGSMVYATCTQTPTSTASWTETATDQAFMDLIIDGIESGGGGGGGGETSHVFAS